MCKSLIVQKILSARKDLDNEVSMVCYVGDGYNDICPALKLARKDVAFVREGSYAFCKHLKLGLKLKCTTVMWKSGLDIVNYHESRNQDMFKC